jgi:CheY-like chemotaxis protein
MRHVFNAKLRRKGEPMARILVIDDEVLVRNTIQLILRHRGHHVVAAECGQRGVEAIEAYAFDAVIVDIFMPGMDGFQTMRILHRSAPKTAIIAMSGYAFHEVAGPAPDFLKMACDLGAACCLRKPLKGWEIIKAVETSIAASRFDEETAHRPEAVASECSSYATQA